MYIYIIEACLIKTHTYLDETFVGWHDLIGDFGAVCSLTLADLFVDGARQVHQLLILLAIVLVHGV